MMILGQGHTPLSMNMIYFYPFAKQSRTMILVPSGIKITDNN